MTLFNAEELGDHLHQQVSIQAAAAAERLVWGWLKRPLGLTQRPDFVSDELFSWAIELGGIAHENPSGLSYYQLGPERYGFSVERRGEILAEAASGHTAAHGGPLGSFPPAEAWPDTLRGR